MNLTLADFPLGLDPTTYLTTLTLTYQTYTEVFLNPLIYSKLTSISLEYEALGTVPCTYTQDSLLLHCNLLLNNNPTLT